MASAQLTTAVGAPLDVSRFAIREALSEGFHVDVIAHADDPNVDLAAIIGHEASFELATGLLHAHKGRRAWLGVVSHAEQVRGVHVTGGRESRTLSTYRLEIVPRLWLLSRRANHRIFQRMSIPDIIDKLLSSWAISPSWKINRAEYKKLELKVQYGESDYTFFSRLLEEAGIAYAIDGADQCKLTLADDLASAPLHEHPPLSNEDEPNDAAQREYATAIASVYEVRSGAYQLADFNFRNPAFRMAGEAKKAPEPENEYELYRYQPGSSWIEGKADGSTPAADDKGAYRADASYLAGRAQRALDGARNDQRAVHFETNVIDLCPGMGVRIEHHPADAVNGAYLVTDFSARGAVNGRWTMSAKGVARGQRLRPLLKTPKPHVFGVQSATVVGPKGQEIHTDEFGRVRAQFPWDKDGQSDDFSSCWMRVSQGWAGTGFGMIAIPRIGQEVLVAFLDGDCDRPIVVGRVYNFLNPVPYKLPENKTTSGWKTNSSPTSGGYNEIKLEDKAGKELLYVQAQKDEHHLVKRDRVTRIERRHRRTVADEQHLIVKKTKKELLEVDSHLHVKGGRFDKIDKGASLIIGVDQDIKVGNKHALSAAKEIHLKAGDKVVIEAGTSLTIKGPGGFVNIHSGGVDIVGTMVKINSGGSAGTGSGAAPTEPKDAEEALPKDSSDEIED